MSVKATLFTRRFPQRLHRFDYFHTMQLAIPKAAEISHDDRRMQVYFIEEATEFQELARRPRELFLDMRPSENLRSFGERVARAAGVDAGDGDIQFAILVPGKGALSSYSILSLVEPSTVASSLMAVLISKEALLGAYQRPRKGSMACILTQVTFRLAEYTEHSSPFAAARREQRPGGRGGLASTPLRGREVEL